MEPTRPEPGLELVDVSVDYGAMRAVDQVTLSVPPGEIVALLGPSGCGKSTLLRAIAGLEPLASGQVHWQGRDLTRVPVHKRGVGLMFQEHALFPHRDVGDNVAFGLRMAKLPAHQVDRDVDAMLRLVGLEGFADRTIGTLSGGQAQRVALARALAPKPDLLLLDEPLGSLDRSLRDRLVHEIRAIVKSLGITAVHVTHDHDEALSVADRLALMDSGRIVRTGSVSDLLANPDDATTAEALGLDTVCRGTISPEGTIDTPAGRVAVDGEVGDDAAVLIKPEAVRIGARGLAATVTSARFRGDAWLISCRLGNGSELVARHPERLDEHQHVALIVDLTRRLQLQP